jgi:hypothetical protein
VLCVKHDDRIRRRLRDIEGDVLRCARIRQRRERQAQSGLFGAPRRPAALQVVGRPTAASKPTRPRRSLRPARADA